MKRRAFLTRALMAGAGSVTSTDLYAAPKRSSTILRFGICADLHHDLIDDGISRLSAFITEMKRSKPDFIVQIGDFCTPKSKNQKIIDIWESFPGSRYHVIGNHDRDGGFSLEQVLQFWRMPSPYYSFDMNGYHFIVLNANEGGPNESERYPRSVSTEQRNWLKQDLAATHLPVIVFCHQGIDNDMDGVREGNHLRIIFEHANREAGFLKVRLVFSGHHHRDYHNIYNGIHYVQINSISYQFKHNNGTFAFAHCKDPLWAFVTVKSDGSIMLEGRHSVYENDREEWDNGPTFDEYATVARISDVSIVNKP